MRTARPWILPHRPTTLDHLLASGVTERMVRTQVANGRLRRLRMGVYLGAEHWPSDAAAQHLTLARAELAAHPCAVLSHNSAALVWGLPAPGATTWSAGPVSLSVPPEIGLRPRPGVVYHRVALPPHHSCPDARGDPVTTQARTVVDLARDLELPGRLVLLDAAARLHIEGLVANPRRRDYANPRLANAAREVFAHVSASCRVAVLSGAIQAADPRRETPIESLSAGHMLLAGLPTPECQAEIRTPEGVFYPDFLWREARLIGEADGALKYSEQRSLVAEKQRELALSDVGYRFVRWLGKEIILTPGLVMARIARALAL